MKDFNEFLNSGISDELIAAYIDGNTTDNENQLIENALNGNSMLSEAYEISHDCVFFGRNFDWDLHKGDYGFWELGLPPVVTEEDLLETYNKTENDMEEKTYGYEPNNELDVFDPNIWQGNQPTCAIRSQEIILRDYGIYHTQNELIEYATQNGWFDPDPENGGTDKYAIGNLLDACGIPTTRTDDATIYDIISELKAGHRVIVSVDADELWVKKEPNLFKRVIDQVNNKANDAIQNFLGLEGANHALVVAGVSVNPKNPSDIKVTLIDSGTGDVCIEYSFKDFHNAWADGHCRMISTDIPAPFQYNYHTHQIEPSNIATTYSPSMAQMPDGLTNQFNLSEGFFKEYRDFSPEYKEIPKIEGIDENDLHESVSDSDLDTDNSKIHDSVQTGYGYEINNQEEHQIDDTFSEDTHESDPMSRSTIDDNDDKQEDNGISIDEGEDDQSDNN